MVSTNNRRCPMCEKHKPDGQFYLRNGRPGGYCKTCSKVKAREREHRRRENVVGIDEARRLRERNRHFRDVASKDARLAGQKTCRCCEEVFDLGSFYAVSGRTDSYCKRCRLTIDKKLNSKSPSNRLTTLISAARSRSKQKRWHFNLTKDFLIDLWHGQDGQCYYTGIPMTFDGNRQSAALSIDRVDSSLGYTIGNIVLCSRRINEMKSNLTVDEFIEICRMVAVMNEKKESKNG